MLVNPIKDGIVLDHIKAGNAMEIYHALGLDELDCQVAIIKNCDSAKMGKKDILKINEHIDINLDVLGYLDPGITVNFIKDSKIYDRKHLELPMEIKDVIKCKNPRCITSTEQELSHIFKLSNREKGVYRCIYCEASAK
ncbi:MAG: aspartate carbamoyltransferase regulatory subunit [Clostridia bacterium]|nr:aspartate carbamoyltransferase regulatory subunit [Clostridia bacterium]